eukprot:jgi/Mesvir1/1213/Mv17699-RA.2
MNFQFSNLLGAPFRGGNVILYEGSKLLTPVGNRISLLDLKDSTATTLPFENSKNVAHVALSPSGLLLISVDQDGRSLLVNLRRKVVLYHFNFKESVACIKFSPDGLFFAVALGKLVQVWRTPGMRKQFAPLQLHRTYAGFFEPVTSIDWSRDSQWFAAGARDQSTRIFSLDPFPGYKPATLAAHRDVVVACFWVDKDTGRPPQLYTVARDGVLIVWQYVADESLNLTYRANAEADAAVGAGDGDGDAMDTEGSGGVGGAVPDASYRMDLAHGRWTLASKHFFGQGARLTCAAYSAPLDLVVAGFASGAFGLWQMPEFTALQVLSMSREALDSISFNETGDWLAIASAALGQLLVWEWRSETYVVKQQGHFYDVRACAYSPDGHLLATGADDNKVKVWNMATGLAFVTFTEHTMPVTAVAFLPSGNAVVSASVDGTVRAFDLVRYRNFRTFTSPTPTQFVSLAVDASGEVLCAGSMDLFQIFVWSVKTGRLLDVLSGHEGPVVALEFSPLQSQTVLASASWDKTVRVWDVFSGQGSVETFLHSHDVLALAYHPNGKLLASATLDGQIYLWDLAKSQLGGTIEGRRDIAGGRKSTDRQSYANLSSGKCFTSLNFSADGSFLIGGGTSKFVCLYDVEEKVLLRRFQISHNKSLEGVLDFLNSRNVTDAGPRELIDDDSDSDEEAAARRRKAEAGGNLPGAKSSTAKRPVVRTQCVRMSPTGSSWAAASTEGLLIYSLDSALLFDPTDLDVDVTPQAIHDALASHSFLKALIIAFRLNEEPLLRRCVEAVPVDAVAMTAQAVPVVYLGRLLQLLADALAESAHLEFVLRWCLVSAGSQLVC